MERNSSPESESGTELVRCAICDFLFREDFIKKHRKLMHKDRNQKISSTSSHSPDLSGKAKKTESVESSTSNYNLLQPGQIILISKKGMRVRASRCAECGISESKLWLYVQSNRGPVCLCTNCKAKVFERSFGKSPKDWLDLVFRG